MIHRFIVLLTLYTLSIHNINAHSFQAKDMLLDEQEDFVASLQQELRTPQYRKEILPNDFSYLSQLISLGTTNNQPPAYLRSVVKMFSNMLKSSHYVNASAFSALLADLPGVIHPYFSLPSAARYVTNSALYDASFTDRFAATVHNALYVKFSTEYESFRQNPDLFLQTISADITAIAQEEVAQEQIRQSIIRFCEIALNKLIWHPGDQEQTWEVTKKIATQLATLLEHNILDDANDLDDLYWTLLNRYCYFIEIAATDMPESFYSTIKNDIATRKNVIFEVPEQDFIIEPKLSYMQRTLMEAETRAYCYNHGLLRR